jgi:hypothetical protein
LKATTNSQKRAYPYRKKRQDGQHRGCQVAVGGERGEAGGQIGAHYAWKDKDEPEEAEAMQSSDGALRFDVAHRLEPRQDIGTEAKQPRDIT